MSRRLPSIVSPAYVAALVLLATSAAGMSTILRLYNIHLQKKPIYAEGGLAVRSLPIETERWVRVGTDKKESAEALDALGTDNYVSRVYALKDPPDPEKPVLIELHAAYYTDMIDTVPHVPERCFLAGGWQQSGDASSVPVPLDSSRWMPDGSGPALVQITNPYSPSRGRRVRLFRDADKLQMRVTPFEHGGSNIRAGYFFIANGGTVARAEDVRLLAFDLSTDYAFYLKVQFNSTTMGSDEELVSAAGSLLDDLLGDLMLCVPDWVKVQAGEYPEDHPRRRASGE